MKVLMFGDLAATGFGTVTADLGPRLLALGLDMRFASINETGADLPDPWPDRTLSIPSLVSIVDAMGNGGVTGADPIIGPLLTGTSAAKLLNGRAWGPWQPDAAIVLGDFVAARHMVARTEAFSVIPTYHYVPIEGVDLPPVLATDLWRVTSPVAMSIFGADQIEKITGTRPPVIWHGVDSAVFHPVAGPDSKRGRPIIMDIGNGSDVTLTSRKDCKDLWSRYFAAPLPAIQTPKGMVHSAKWMVRTDRHMPRKRYPSLFRSLSPVLQANPDAILLIHCIATDQGGTLTDTIAKMPQAERIVYTEPNKPEAWSLFGRPYAQILLTNQNGWPREALTALYNAADLYVSVSAEGFGLTIAEAMACGTPAVGIDYSAVPEVIGPGGKTVAISGLIDNEYDHYWAAVDERAYGETVHDLLNRPTVLEGMGREARRHVTSSFSWDTAAAAFADLLRGNSWQPLSASKPSAITSPSLALAASGAPA